MRRGSNAAFGSHEMTESVSRDVMDKMLCMTSRLLLLLVVVVSRLM